MLKELGFKKVAKISERRKERLRSAKPDVVITEKPKLEKTETIKKLEKGESLAPTVTKSRDGWIPGDQSKFTTPVKKTFKKVKAFTKDYTSGNQGWFPGDQTALKANITKGYGKVKAFTKDYFSGNQGYIPGNQTKLKSRISKGWDDLKDIKTHLSQRGDSPLLKKKKKKKDSLFKNNTITLI